MVNRAIKCIDAANSMPVITKQGHKEYRPEVTL